MNADNNNLARYIDHTLLKPETRAEDIDRLCDEARAAGFFSVCVPPCYVRRCADALADTPVKVCTVIGLPVSTLTWVPGRSTWLVRTGGQGLRGAGGAGSRRRRNRHGD